MSSFADYLTVEGERLLANAAAGKATITFTKVVMGTGYMPANTNTKNMTGVVTPVKELEVKSVALNDNTSVVVSAYFSNETIEEGFYFREKGIYMSDGDEEVLGIYGNAGTNAEFIDTAAVCTIEKSIRTVINMTSDELANITLKTGTEARAPIIIDGLTLVEFVKTDTALTIEDGQMVILNDIVYIFTGGDSSAVENYSPGMKLSDVYKEKVEGADANGGIGASQNALHAVYEVAADINNKTPTYTEASTLATLTSGEKLSVAFGKIKKAISTLISHIATSATTSVSGHVKFGTASGTACQGNDSRLSNARTPTSHASTGTGYGVGTASNYGHVKLTSSSAVTDTTGLALAATEKNASISGTLANQISSLNEDLTEVSESISELDSELTEFKSNKLYHADSNAEYKGASVSFSTNSGLINLLFTDSAGNTIIVESSSVSLTTSLAEVYPIVLRASKETEYAVTIRLAKTNTNKQYRIKYIYSNITGNTPIVEILNLGDRNLKFDGIGYTNS